jgi:hypothetical protein
MAKGAEGEEAMPKRRRTWPIGGSKARLNKIGKDTMTHAYGEMLPPLPLDTPVLVMRRAFWLNSGAPMVYWRGWTGMFLIERIGLDPLGR